MSRRWLLCCGFCIVVAAHAQATPARTPCGQVLPSELTRSAWHGPLYDRESWIRFHPDGTLTYFSSAYHDALVCKGVWRLSGQRLYFQVQSRSEHEALVEGDIIQGQGFNRSQEGYALTLYRKIWNPR